MKIIILSSMYPNSQVYMSGIFVHENVKSLQKLGVEITVLAPIPFIPWPFNLFSEKWKKFYRVPKKEIIEDINIVHTRYIALPRGLLKHMWSYLYVIPIYLFLLKCKNKNTIDFIHAHGSLPDDYSAKILSNLLNIPYLLTVHGETVYMKKKKSHLKKSISAIKSATAVIGVSDKVIERIKKKSGRGKGLFKVYNGFTPEKIDLKLTEKNENEINVLFGAGLIERKGCEYLLKAFGKLLKSYKNIYLTIAGGGPLFTQLKDLSELLNISANVKFLGVVKHSTMLELMANCDIFILPSWDEAFGVVYLEAMSFKKPVIGTIEEGISEIIVDGKNGFLVRPKNSDDIYQKLKILIEDKYLRIEIGEKGFEAIQNLTWENNAKEILNIYNNVKY